MEKNPRYIIPLIIVLILVIFIVPITYKFIKTEDPSVTYSISDILFYLNTPIQELNNLSLNDIFDIDNTTILSKLNNQSFNDILLNTNLITNGVFTGTFDPTHYYYEQDNINNSEITYNTAGNTVNQVGVNGEFDTSTTGWTQLSTTGFTVVGGVGEFTATALNGQINPPIWRVIGQTYYVVARVKSTSSSVFLNSNINSVYHSGSGNFELLSFITTATSVGTGAIADDRSSGWDKVYVDYFMAIDITNTRLSLLTASQIDQITPTYFEGLRTVMNSFPYNEIETLYDLTTSFGTTFEPTLLQFALLQQFYIDNINSKELVYYLFNLSLTDEQYNYYHVLYLYYSSL